MKTSIQTKLLAAILLSCIMPFLFLVGVVLWPYYPLKVTSFTVENKQPFILGTPVIVKLVGYKNTDKPVKIICQMINSRSILYSPVEGSLPRGPVNRERVLETSVGDLPGTYYVRCTHVYTYFGFWDVIVPVESVPFEAQSSLDETKPGAPGKRGPRGDRGPAGKDFWGK